MLPEGDGCSKPWGGGKGPRRYSCPLAIPSCSHPGEASRLTELPCQGSPDPHQPLAIPSWANSTALWPLDAAQPGSPGNRAALAPHRASNFLAPGFLLFFRGVVLQPQEGHSTEQPGAPGGDSLCVEQPTQALCACGTTMAELGGAGLHRASVHGQGDASVTGPLACATAPRITEVAISSPVVAFLSLSPRQCARLCEVGQAAASAKQCWGKAPSKENLFLGLDLPSFGLVDRAPGGS